MFPEISCAETVPSNGNTANATTAAFSFMAERLMSGLWLFRDLCAERGERRDTAATCTVAAGKRELE
jgi:hypothetical protein